MRTAPPVVEDRDADLLSRSLAANAWLRAGVGLVAFRPASSSGLSSRRFGTMMHFMSTKSRDTIFRPSIWASADRGRRCPQGSRPPCLPGADAAVAFIGTTFRRAEGERVARLAVEKLALLAAISALNKVSPRHAELLAETRCRQSRGHVWCCRPQRRRHACPVGARLALNKPSPYQTPTRRERSLCQLKVG